MKKSRSAVEPAGSPLSAPLRSRISWTDFHVVLTVSREGSVARACSALGMTHSTLLRKLYLIESRLRTRLFERVRGRYTLTAAGSEIEQVARAFEPQARAVEARVLGQDLRPSGEVRVSVASILLEHLLPQVLRQFVSAFPDVRLELVTSRELVSLRRSQTEVAIHGADVVIRVADQVPQWLIGRKLADLHFKVYGLRGEETTTSLRPVAKLAAEKRWIGFEREAGDLKIDRWLASAVPEQNVVLRVDNFSHALTMVRAGLGVALLPAFLEGCIPDLRPLSKPITALRTPLWLISHPELRNTARIQVLMRSFAPALANAVQTTQGDKIVTT